MPNLGQGQFWTQSDSPEVFKILVNLCLNLLEFSDKKSTWTLDTNRMNYCVGTFMSYVLSYYAVQCSETMTESLSVLKIAVW